MIDYPFYYSYSSCIDFKILSVKDRSHIIIRIIGEVAVGNRMNGFSTIAVVFFSRSSWASICSELPQLTQYCASASSSRKRHFVPVRIRFDSDVCMVANPSIGVCTHTCMHGIAN